MDSFYYKPKLMKKLLTLLLFCSLFVLDVYAIEYGSDILTGGTATAYDDTSGAHPASQACDDNEGVYWQDSDAGEPTSWWKYDLGVAVTKTVRKLRIKNYGSSFGINAFKLQGSNNDADWTDITSDNCADNSNWQDFTFANSTAYRYYQVFITTGYHAIYVVVYEFEMMEEALAASQVIIIPMM